MTTDTNCKYVFEFVSRWARETPSHKALMDENGSISYTEFLEKSYAFASFLISLGLNLNDSIAYKLETTFHFFYMYMGASMIGVSCVGINKRSTDEEARNIMGMSGAKYLFTNIDSNVSNTIALTDSIFDKKLSYSDINSVEKRMQKITSDTTVFIIYTSGTTGIPKGARISHKNIIASTTMQSRDFLAPGGCTNYDIFQHYLPLNHVSGAIEWGFCPFVSGSTIYLHKKFDANRILQTVERFHMRMLAGVPTMWDAFFIQMDKVRYNLKSVEWCLSGATYATRQQIEKIYNEFPVCTNPLGMTELSGFCSGFGSNATANLTIDTVGKIYSNLQCKIVDTFGNERVNGEIGRIAYKGDAVISGYTIGEMEKTQDGYMISSDLAFVDEHSYIHLCGRSDDMFSVGGYNVYPMEIERIIMDFNGVSQVAVVPEIHHSMGWVPKAYIIENHRGSIDLGKLKEYLREKLIYYKIPREIEIIEHFPTNSLGKIQKNKLT